MNKNKQIDAMRIKYESDLMDRLPRVVYEKLDLFGQGFRPPRHPMTGEPIDRFVGHQCAMWDDMLKYNQVIYPKGQKVGATTICCLRLIQVAQSWGMGRRLMVVAANQAKCVDIIEMIKAMYAGSIYSDYVIYKHLFCDRHLPDSKKTTSRRICLRNPDDPDRPTEILSCPITSLAGLSGNSRACFVYASDITLAGISGEKMERSYAMMHGRLMAGGQIVIEGPPGRAEGPVWDICKSRKTSSKDGYVEIDMEPGMSDKGCWVRRLPSQMGVDAGITSQKHLDGLKGLSPDAPLYYDACFDERGTEMQRLELMEHYAESMTAGGSAW